MIEVVGLRKAYGDKVAVDDLTMTVRPGIVTGFLGPNGAGKSTAMRCILGLDRPDAGHISVNGKQFRNAVAPMTEVGALLEARSIHGGRSATGHLLALATTHGIGKRRVREVLELVGLADVAGQRAGSFSLGMGQRLGIAAALLGDPQTLLLDEPVNGLDPEGIRWVRVLLRQLADEGRTILVSSHLMSEMALTAHRLVVVGRGRLVAEAGVEDLIRSAGTEVVTVRTPAAAALTTLLESAGAQVSLDGLDRLAVRGVTSDRIGDLAAEHGIALHELIPTAASLEDAFMALTADAVDFHATTSAVTATSMDRS